MSYLTGLRCIQCGVVYPAGKMYKGCPRHRQDRPVGLTAQYDYAQIERIFDKRLLEGRPPTMWRYREFLPPEAENVVSMDEGMTPLLKCASLAETMGLQSVYVKDESRAPTWSLNDRLSSVGVSMARQFRSPAVTLASSGDAGASVSAYAARIKMACVIFTLDVFPPTPKIQMQVNGAMVIAAATLEERWHLVESCVDAYDWFPIGPFSQPPIGYNPYAIEGWKTIGYEICEQMDWDPPDVVIFPVGHGDPMSATWKAFREFADLGLIHRLPRMVAAEPHGPLKNALAKGLDHVEPMPTRPTVAVSVGTNQSTYAALTAVRDSGGHAETATDEEIMTMQLELAQQEGIYADPSSVISLAVLKKLQKQGRIGEDEKVVAILDAAGIKQPEATAEHLPKIPLVEGNAEDVRRALEKYYRYPAS